jgi:DNA-binding transcriptional MerR regulator
LERDFTKPLTILVSGSANTTIPNIEDNLIDWIFGGRDERDVTVVVPYRSEMGKGMANFLVWGMDFFQWDQPEGDTLLAGVAPEGGHKSISHASKTWQAKDYSEAMGWCIGQLTSAREDGNEIAVISLYNEEDDDDLKLITYAKQLGIPTFDLAMSMVDNFAGFKTEAQLEEEARAKEEFDKALAEVIDETPKKAAAPRKRAAKKTVASKAADTLQEDEKPLQDVPVGTTVEVAGEKFTKVGENPFAEAANTLSADVTVPRKGPNPHRAPLPGNPMYDQKPITEVSEATVTVKKSDLVGLAESMKQMGTGFTNAIDILTRVIEGA